MSALPPTTIEGWFALHQVFAIDQDAMRDESVDAYVLAEHASTLLGQLNAAATEGWSEAFRLVGGGADLLLVHFRPTLEELADVQAAVRVSGLARVLRLQYDYTSVTEAGLYHATAEAAREHAPGSDEFRQRIDEAVAAEKASAHIRSRLYPQIPDGMRYVSFYPMSKRRGEGGGANWYTLDVAERSRLMRDHGMTGRRFAGRIYQVITGSVGLDDWEWGVTLFARDPLDFKRIVTNMRYDEASALYGEFGSFYTGIRLAPGDWETLLGGGPRAA